MYKALYLSPMIPSFDIKETILFFQNLFEFQIAMNETTYAILHKDNLTIHILPANEGIGQMEFYLEVDDVEKLWKGINGKLAGLKYKALFNREYGMREIHIEIPKTNTLMFIGQELKNA